MRLLKPRFVVVVTISCVIALPSVQAQKPSAERKRPAPASVTNPAPVAEVIEPEIVAIPPMDPEELPPSAPRVSFKSGRLTIDANNATLRDVLVAVQKVTGAVIDVPAESASERVALHLSGVPKSVLPELLDGSAFGYILRSSPEDPVGIAEVVLTRKANLPKAAVRVANGRGSQHMKPPESVAERRMAAEATPPPVSVAAENTPASSSETASASSPQTSAPPAAEAIPALESTDSSSPAQTLSAAVDPHPAPPVQIADPQTPEQKQKQTDTNRQFMQDMYSARQKMQTQP